MKRVLQRKQGVAGLIVIMTLLFLFLLGAQASTYAGDGIGQPGDGLNSTPPPTSGETTNPLESLLLFVTVGMLV